MNNEINLHGARQNFVQDSSTLDNSFGEYTCQEALPSLLEFKIQPQLVSHVPVMAQSVKRQIATLESRVRSPSTPSG